MSNRKIYHIVPDTNKGGWKVKKENSERASSIHLTKDEAIEQAKQFAKKNPLSQIIVHKQDGTIQIEWTYGKDPRKYKG